jgi:hypothetical protein
MRLASATKTSSIDLGFWILDFGFWIVAEYEKTLLPHDDGAVIR